ncbi:MAG TPA: hypothetical protein PLG56_06050, partial [Lacunisphaera sp.]|nr:hypothetical protein [Lacunisphaera sp.]
MDTTHATPSLPVAGHPPDALADFSTDRRVLLLCAFAVPIGVLGAVVAKALLWLIAVITNAAFFLRWSAAPATPEMHHLGWWVVLVPAAGSLLIGLMARYGSEKIRGHGIPEALEAILLGRSLEIDRTTLIGDLLCLLAGFLYTFYILIAQRARETLGGW